MGWKTLDDMDLEGKVVLTRVDINVPVEDGEVTDATRIERIVPTVRDIGLWGPKVQKAYQDMGVMQFADLDPDALSAQDEDLARKMDTSQGLSPETEEAVRRSGVDRMRAFEVEHTIDLGRDAEADAG